MELPASIYQLPYPLYDDGDNLWLDAPCGCVACSRGVQPGHWLCDQAPEELVRAESRGIIFRVFDDGRWRWLVARRPCGDAEKTGENHG